MPVLLHWVFVCTHPCADGVMELNGQGHKQPLEAEDIFGLAPDDRVEATSKDFRVQWHKELEKPQGPSLVRPAASLRQPRCGLASAQRPDHDVYLRSVASYPLMSPCQGDVVHHCSTRCSGC
jgi:hypothetical protein